jgi:hypothetical protein
MRPTRYRLRLTVWLIRRIIVVLDAMIGRSGGDTRNNRVGSATRSAGIRTKSSHSLPKSKLWEDELTEKRHKCLILLVMSAGLEPMTRSTKD